MDPPEYCRLVPEHLVHVADDGQPGRPRRQPPTSLTLLPYDEQEETHQQGGHEHDDERSNSHVTGIARLRVKTKE